MIPGIAVDQLLDIVHLPREEWRLEDLVNLKEKFTKEKNI